MRFRVTLRSFYAISLAFIVVFLIFPLAILLKDSLSIILGINKPLPEGFLRYLLKVTANTLNLAFLTTFFSVIIGVPIAFLIVKFDVYLADLWSGLFTIPLISPAFISSFAVVILLGKNGLLSGPLSGIGIVLPSVYGLLGLVITETIHSIPYVILLTAAGLRTVPLHYEEAALSLGTSVFRIQYTIVLPYIYPHILMSALMVFLTSIGDLGTPLIIGGGYKVLSLEIYSNFVTYLADKRIPLIFGAWVIIISTAMVILTNYLLKLTNVKRKYYPEVKIYENRRVKLIGMIVTLFILVILLMPYVVILWSSFKVNLSNNFLFENLTLDNYRRIFKDLTPVKNTLILIVSVAPIALFLGVFLSDYMQRGKGAYLNHIVLVPFILPGVIVGVSLIKSFFNIPFLKIGTTGLVLLMIVAITIRRLPFVIKTIETGLNNLDRSQEEQALALGAPELKAFLTIILPQVKPFIFTATIILLFKVVTELSASLTIYPPGWQNMSIYIAYYVEEGFIPRAAAMSIILIIIVEIGAIVANRFANKAYEYYHEKFQLNQLSKDLLTPSFNIAKPYRKRLRPSGNGNFLTIIGEKILQLPKRILRARTALIVFDYSSKPPKPVDANRRMLKLLGLPDVPALQHIAPSYLLHDIIQAAEETASGLPPENTRGELIDTRGRRVLVNISGRMIGSRVVIYISPVSEYHGLKREIEELKRQAAKSELKALKAQINPHFMFNTLNTIIQLIQTDREAAIQTVGKLADLFRYSLSSTREESVPLFLEIEQLKKLLEIEKLRHGDRLNYRLDVDSSLLSFKIQPLLIQPLVENAIRYGKDTEGNVYLTVKVERNNRMIVISVRDYGSVQVNPHDIMKSGGTGLRNVNNRLKNLYNSRLHFRRNDPQGLIVEMHIPTLRRI